MSQILEAESDEVYVANPRQMRLFYASVANDDRLDAMRLAKLADLEVLNTRALLVQIRASVVNHIRGVLKSVQSPGGAVNILALMASATGQQAALRPLAV